MAKTNRRPVDRLERQQRLAKRNNSRAFFDNESVRNAHDARDQFYGELDSELEEHSVDQSIAA